LVIKAFEADGPLANFTLVIQKAAGSMFQGHGDEQDTQIAKINRYKRKHSFMKNAGPQTVEALGYLFEKFCKQMTQKGQG
jgi:hypothetical protein